MPTACKTLNEAPSSKQDPGQPGRNSTSAIPDRQPPLCPRYTLSLNGEEVFVMETPDAAVARPRVKGAALLEVGVRGRFEKVVIRPLSHHIQAEVTAEKIRFPIPGTGYYCLELDDDLDYPLVILVDEAIHVPANGDVVVLGPGYHSAADFSLRDGQTLYLDHDAWVEGGLHLKGLKNIRVLGTGILDGRKTVGRKSNNPLLIEACENVEVEGPMLISLGQWNCIVRRSRHVTISRIKIVSSAKCSDGVDIDGSSQVTVSDSFVKCNDDCLCIKSAPPAAGLSVANIEFRDCVLWNGPGGNGIEIGYESQCETFRDIAFRRICIVHALAEPQGGWVDRQAALSIHITHDALVQNVLFEDIVIEDNRMAKAIQFTTFHYYREHGWFSPPDRLARGKIRRVHLKNITFHEVFDARIHIEGFNGPNDIDGVVFENVTFAGIPAQDLEQLSFEKVNTTNFEWK